MTTRADAQDRLLQALAALPDDLVSGGVSRGFRLSGQLAFPALSEAVAWRYDGNQAIVGLSVTAPATAHVFRVACFSGRAAGADKLVDATWLALRKAGFPTILYEGEGVVGDLAYQRLGVLSH